MYVCMYVCMYVRVCVFFVVVGVNLNNFDNFFFAVFKP